MAILKNFSSFKFNNDSGIISTSDLTKCNPLSEVKFPISIGKLLTLEPDKKISSNFFILQIFDNSFVFEHSIPIALIFLLIKLLGILVKQHPKQSKYLNCGNCFNALGIRTSVILQIDKASKFVNSPIFSEISRYVFI